MITILDYPDLYQEWDFEKNKNIDISTTSYKSNKKVWWICSQNNKHTWQAEIRSRSCYNKTGCPYCAGKKILSNDNSLLARNPELCKEWDYSKNIIKPDEISPYSHKSAWWICKYKHSWKAKILHRSYGSRCPQCTNHRTSFGERTIYFYLQEYNAKNQYKYIYNNQKYEIDIYLPEQNIGIEFNGLYYHRNKKKKDKEKEKFLSKYINLFYICEGTKNYKYKNKIYFDCKHKYNDNLEWAINKLFKLLKFNIKINLEKDRQDIYKLSVRITYNNSLLNKYPNVCKEWDYSKNKITPDMVTASSGYKVWWICPKSHSYETTVSNRIRAKVNGCPYCTGHKILAGYNDLLTKYPDLCKEWNYSKNDISPSTVSGNTNKQVWWICPKGHEWKSYIISRTYNWKSNCPYCSGKMLIKGKNDLLTLYPNICKEWDYSKNTIKPDEITVNSGRKAWWTCQKGHSYQAIIANRVNAKINGCPYCTGHKILTGYNDLLTKCPNLCKEWNYSKNNIDPSTIGIGYKKKVWWICSEGHEWETYLTSRTYKKMGNCPICNKGRRK